MAEWIEPEVNINGEVLSFGQSMTLRVALQNFITDLHDPSLKELLGPISIQYAERCREIERLMAKSDGLIGSPGIRENSNSVSIETAKGANE